MVNSLSKFQQHHIFYMVSVREHIYGLNSLHLILLDVYKRQELYGEEGSIHIEVLLPAFVLGMIMKHKDCLLYTSRCV